MNTYLQTIVLAALVGGTASEVWAQQRPATQGLGSAVQAEWRTPIPRTDIYLKYKGELNTVEFLNHNVGWAIGDGRPHTMLFRTADGGASWERQTLFDGEGSHLSDIGFADANNGWIVGRSHILRTTDGGESWEPVDVPTPWATKLLVLGPDAIVVGSDGSNQNKQILRTLDGGRTWDRVSLARQHVDGRISGTVVTGLALAEPSTIFATTGTTLALGEIYRSDDGGHSWTSVAEAEGKPLMGIAFRGKRGVAVGDGTAFWTEDGGDTWRRVAMPGTRYAVDFIDENTVVAVGSSPDVVISRNGGKTWQPTPGPIVQVGRLVDVAVVDPGWWFVAGQTALYQFVDPNHTEPIASGRIPLPVDVQLPGGRALPRGLYDVMLGHRGDQHVLKLDRKGDVPVAGQTPTGSATGSATGSEAAAQREASAGLEAAVARQKGQKPPACAQPCTVTVPARVTYEKEDIKGGDDMKSFLRFSLEPTESGVAVVVRTAVTPPRNVALALAAVGAPQSSEKEAGQAAKKTADKVGGLFGRIQKAAAGDLRGAAAGSGVNPQATQKRLRAAKAAPPAVYKVTVRHTLDVFGEKKN